MPNLIQVDFDRMNQKGGMEAMTVKQTADAMGCSEQTVRNLIQSGELPGVKLGKRFYVSRAAFEALIKGE